MKTAWIFVIVLIVMGFGTVGGYNNLVKQQETVHQAWSQVENVYQRRLDLIPNLVATV